MKLLLEGDLFICPTNDVTPPHVTMLDNSESESEIRARTTSVGISDWNDSRNIRSGNRNDLLKWTPEGTCASTRSKWLIDTRVPRETRAADAVTPAMRSAMRRITSRECMTIRGRFAPISIRTNSTSPTSASRARLMSHFFRPL